MNTTDPKILRPASWIPASPRDDESITISASISDLIKAVVTDDAPTVKRLLDFGVDPNGHEDTARIRPLHFAAQNNALHSAILLIKAGADTLAETSEEETPLDVAKSSRHKEMVELLSNEEGRIKF